MCSCRVCFFRLRISHFGVEGFQVLGSGFGIQGLRFKVLELGYILESENIQVETQVNVK